MIKSIVSGFVALGVLATPVAAEARHRDRGYDRGHHSRISTGEAIAIGIGGLIVGAAIAGGNRQVQDREVYDRYIPRYRRNCYDYVVTDYDRWGRRWERVETRCY